MSLKSLLSKPIARRTFRRVHLAAKRAVQDQDAVLRKITAQAMHTSFGKDHDFKSIYSHQDLVDRVPLRDYEALKPYIERVVAGEENVLWPGKPVYLAKTSGTTSGAKYIPISRQSVGHHVNAAKNALLCFIAKSSKATWVGGKMIFLQGSPILELKGDIPIGRLSGITAHWIPKYLQKNRLPSWETNCIEDWEEKVEKVVEETKVENMTLISGIPSWLQMYFERLLDKTGRKNVSEVFPNLELLVYGGVNFEPYRSKFKQLIGRDIPIVETYPASEGFIAYQDDYTQPGLLLNTNAGMYFEFVPANEIFNENPTRLSLAEVELNVNYAIILHTNAGLWGYNIGDTVKFVSLKPFRVVVTGRIKHFTSAFGEHVIAEEVEEAIVETLDLHAASINEFHLAPQVSPKDSSLPYHEWFISFEEEPANMDKFRLDLDKALQTKNPYYLDLIEGSILQTLKITKCGSETFRAMMEERGKLGGQNKVPRLANDRNIAQILEKHL